MKKITLYLFIAFMGGIWSCTEDDFLEKYPMTSISPETFFKTGNDFRLYVNQFYPNLGGSGQWDIGKYDNDAGSDNQITHTPSDYLNGYYVQPVTDDTWDDAYTKVRNINILLANTGNVDMDEIKTYVGEALFFRAWHYFRLLRRFGGVPWIGKPLELDDEELYSARVSRNVLCDSIVADLDRAVSYLESMSQSDEMRINREVALAFKSRVCLFEGTWEKYHGKASTPFAINADGTKYLEQAIEAAEAVISTGNYSIFKEGDEPYYNLFNREDYSDNPEVLLWRKYSRDTHSQNMSSWIREGREWGLTRNIVNSYLCTDGQPISTTSLTVDDYSLTTLIQNRDPRLAQTIFYPGAPTLINDASGETEEVYTYPDLSKVRTGFHMRKGGSVLASNLLMNMDQVAYIYFRYAEVLLNYIEAKAELFDSNGSATLTQDDFEKSINKLRDRVGMPHFDYASPVEDVNAPFTGSIPWYLVEIRRERRIELLCEGFRYDDIRRWEAADELIAGKIFRGANFQWYVDEEFYQADQFRFVDEEGVLSPWYNTEIDNQGGYGFNLNRDYLYPIPQQEETLAGYENNPGWE